jgi:hypothetical protein
VIEGCSPVPSLDQSSADLAASEIYKKKLLLSPLIIEAYSLSPRTVYHLDDKSCPRNIPEVLTHVPAAHEKPIEIFIFASKQ